jgi:hypothetical protein
VDAVNWRTGAAGIAVVALVALVSCGGGGPTAASGPSGGAGSGGSRTSTFSGTTRISDLGTCSGERHTFDAGEGTVAVTLVQSSAGPLKAEVCPTASTNHALDCAIPPFAVVAPGQTLSAPLKGGRSQFLTIFPEGCGAPGTPAPTPPITYSVTVVFPG